MLVTANIFQPLIDVFASVISFYHDNLGVSWGAAIVLLTVSVRLVLVPLAWRQFRSMRKLQHLQPQMKAIQQKYKADKQRQQEEMMKFYRENEVNPLGSCLPMVFQLPVFISLYYMLREKLRLDICGAKQAAYQHQYAVAHHITFKAAAGQTVACGPHAVGAGFLFIPDITNTASGVTLGILVVLYVGTQIASTLLMSAPTMDKTQRNMMLVLPLVFVLFILRFPAGLILYWITTNAWTMAQQYTIKRVMGPVPVAAAADTGAAGVIGDGDGGPSGGGSRPRGRSSGGGDSEGGLGGLAALLRGRGPRGGGNGSSSGKPAAAERAPGAAPPPSPRKKRKRSGRRR